MFLQGTRREVLRLFLGGGLLGAWRALFGATATAAPPRPPSRSWPSQRCVSYSYDGSTSLVGTNLGDQLACRSTFVYDSMGRLTQVIQPPWPPPAGGPRSHPHV